MFKLNVRDIAKGVALAVIVAVLGALQQAVTAHGFDLASYNWSMIFDLAVTSGIGYLTKNFLSDDNGKLLGRIG